INCTISTRSPCPTARNAVPKAQVVFPLPGPVYTISNPFSFPIHFPHKNPEIASTTKFSPKYPLSVPVIPSSARNPSSISAPIAACQYALLRQRQPLHKFHRNHSHMLHRHFSQTLLLWRSQIV